MEKQREAQTRSQETEEKNERYPNPGREIARRSEAPENKTV